MKSVALPWGNPRSHWFSARIAKRLRALDLSTPAEYLDYVKKNEGAELVELLDAISTNVTSFFREAQHFVLYG